MSVALWAFSGGERGLIAACRLLVAVASLAAEHRLQQMWHMGSAVVVLGLSCPAVHEIFRNQGMKLSPALQVDSLLLSHNSCTK